MTGDDERGRRFFDREVGLIIKRATELHQMEPVESERSGGMSLLEPLADHITQIARVPSPALPDHANRGTGIMGRA